MGVTVSDNEFLRKRPAQRNRNILFDISNLIIPILIALIGIIIFTQTFARLVGYDSMYTDMPFYVTQKKFWFIDEGYPFFNPGLVFLNILANPFDKVIQAVILQALFPLIVLRLLSSLLSPQFTDMGLTKTIGYTDPLAGEQKKI